MNHNVAVEPPLQVDRNVDALALGDSDVSRQDLERRVIAATQEGTLERSAPLAVGGGRDQQHCQRQRRQPSRRPRAASRGRCVPEEASVPADRSLPRVRPPGSAPSLRSAVAPRNGRHTGRPSGRAGPVAETGSRSPPRCAAWSTIATAISRAARGPPPSTPPQRRGKRPARSTGARAGSLPPRAWSVRPPRPGTQSPGPGGSDTGEAKPTDVRSA